MQGIWLGGRRPKSKKEIKEWVAEGKDFAIQATSVHGNEWEGRLENLPAGIKINFVGPDPYSDRRFYGVIERIAGKIKVS